MEAIPGQEIIIPGWGLEGHSPDGDFQSGRIMNESDPEPVESLQLSREEEDEVSSLVTLEDTSNTRVTGCPPAEAQMALEERGLSRSEVTFKCACCGSTGQGPGIIHLNTRDSSSVVEALSTLFEYPLVKTKGQGILFRKEDLKSYDLCGNCGGEVSELYKVFTRFTELLEREGQIFKTLTSVVGDPSDRRRVSRRKCIRDRAKNGSGDSKLTWSSNRLSARNRKNKVADGSEVDRVFESSSRGRPRRKLGQYALKKVKDGGVAGKAGVCTDGDLFTSTTGPDSAEWSDFPVKEKRSQQKRRNSKNPSDSSPVTDDPESDQSPLNNNKRVRNWKKETWIDKAKTDPSRTCDLCGKSFIFPAVMTRHKRIVHQGLKPFECSSCGKRFTQKVILNKHTCDFSKESGNRDYLQMTREDQLRKFICSVCGKRFKYPTHLSLHEMNHRDERPYPCPTCTKSFRRPDHLKYHMRIVHVEEKKFICTTCGQTFKSISSLRAHEKKHNTSEQGHLCNICGKSIKSMYQMSRHQKTHQDVLPFECPVCGKRFKMKDYLGQHLRRGKTCSKKSLPPNKDVLPDFVTLSSSSRGQITSNSLLAPTSQVPLLTLKNPESTRKETGLSPIPFNARSDSVEFSCFPGSAIVVDERLLTEL